jgi:N-acyl-D-amino-acid deacylase
MKYEPWLTVLLCFGFIMITSCGPASDYDVIIRGGSIYDGSGGAAHIADVAIQDDVIAAIGDLDTLRGRIEIDATGKAVTPGFINMLSWANESLLQDGRSMSDIFQGVTLEIMGEGWSMGPWNEDMKQEEKDAQGDIQFDIKWTTLGEYLQHLEDRGVSTNVASFVGAATVRIHEIGYEDRDATPEEMDRMKALIRQAMEEGAVGVGSSLPYVPANFAPTEELIELAKVAAEYDGLYITHIRDEGDHIFAYIISNHPRSRITTSWTRFSAASKPPKRRDLQSPQICIPTMPARPGWIMLCRRGFRKEATTHS